MTWASGSFGASELSELSELGELEGMGKGFGYPEARGWFGHGAWWHTWRSVKGEGRTEAFVMPELRNQSQVREKEGLGTAKGREGYRLEVG